MRKNQTDAEKVLWRYLRNRQKGGLKFFRQYSVGKYILDFYCPILRLAIELDGGGHMEAAKVLYDKNRTEYLNGFGVRVMRFWDNDVLKNIEGVVQKIDEAISCF